MEQKRFLLILVVVFLVLLLMVFYGGENFFRVADPDAPEATEQVEASSTS